MNTYITSSAEIIKTGEQCIIIVDIDSPETIISNIIKSFFTKTGFSSVYPNFKGVNIGNVHPFALFLAQRTQGEAVNLNVLPSITVSASSESSDMETLGFGGIPVSITATDYSKLRAGIIEKKLFCSSQGISILDAIFAADPTTVLKGTQVEAKDRHTIDCNIWSRNKDLTSILFDLTKHALLHGIQDMRSSGIEFQGQMSGNRSGDVNLDFGSLLYGSNVQISAPVDSLSLLIDVPGLIVNEIIAQGEFHTV